MLELGLLLSVLVFSAVLDLYAGLLGCCDGCLKIRAARAGIDSSGRRVGACAIRNC